MMTTLPPRISSCLSGRVPLRIAVIKRGFTLVELLVVIAVIAIVIGISSSAILEVARGQGMKRAVTEISGLVEEGRIEAMAASTWTWIGFVEQTNNNERELLAVLMVSKDGTQDRSAANLRMAVRPLRLKNVKVLPTLTDWIDSGTGSYAGTTALADGNLSFPATINGQAITFTGTVLGFNPRGEATINESAVPPWIEIGLREMRGTVEIPEKTASLRISGFSGQQNFAY